jgi:hypothetical protein
MANLSGLTADHIRENGTMASSTGRACMHNLVGPQSTENGEKANVISG